MVSFARLAFDLAAQQELRDGDVENTNSNFIQTSTFLFQLLRNLQISLVEFFV